MQNIFEICMQGIELSRKDVKWIYKPVKIQISMIVLKVIKNVIYLVNEGERGLFEGADQEIYVYGR